MRPRKGIGGRSRLRLGTVDLWLVSPSTTALRHGIHVMTSNTKRLQASGVLVIAPCLTARWENKPRQPPAP